MSKLKNSLDSISHDTETIVKDYLRLLMVKQTEKFALFLGILSSVFIISTLLLIVVIISSLALSFYLNSLMETESAGFWIVAGFYLIVIIFLTLKVVRSKTPLLTNLFVKLIVSVLDVDVKQAKTIKGMKLEKERINEKLDADKDKIKADLQLLRYGFMEGFMKEVLGLFKKRKRTSKSKSHSAEATEGEI
jgi:hypothetical protein